MLLWDMRLSPYRERLECLDADALLKIAESAIAHVLSREFDMPPALREAFDRELDLMTRGIASPSHDLVELATDTRSPGVYDISMAVLAVTEALPTLDPGVVFEVLSYSYQAVLDQEILSRLTREVTESNINQLEAANESCVVCIEHQIAAIENASRYKSSVR